MKSHRSTTASSLLAAILAIVGPQDVSSFMASNSKSISRQLVHLNELPKTNGAFGEEDVLNKTDKVGGATAGTMTSEGDVNAALEALSKQVSTLSEELEIQTGLNNGNLDEIIDRKLQELQEGFSDTTWNLQRDVEKLQFQVSELERGDTSKTEVLIHKMTESLRDDLQELEAKHQEESHRLEVDLKKQVSTIQDSVSMNDSALEDAIAVEMEKLEGKFRESINATQERFDEQLDGVQDTLKRQYESINEELNRRDQKLDQEMKEASFRLAKELSDRDMRLYKLLEQRDREMGWRDKEIDASVNKVGLRVNILYTLGLARVAFLKFFVGK